MDLFYLKITTISSVFFLIILVFLEVRHLKNIITPFFFSAIPFIVILPLANFILIDWKFPPVTIRTQLFIVGCLLLVWISGFIISSFFPKKKQVEHLKYSKFTEEFAKFELVIIAISWIVILAVFKKVFSLFSAHGGFAYYGNQEYENEMIVGFVAHLVQVGKICFIFLAFIFKKVKHKKFSIITLFFLGLTIASIQVKYALIFVIIISFLFYVIEKPLKKQIKIMILFGLLLFLIMNLFWITLTLAWGTFGFSRVGIWEFLLKQTLNYFVTGPIVLDNWLNHPAVKPDWTILVVVFNLFNFITGNFMRYNAVHLVSLNFQQTAPGLYSNVGTAYGMYYLIGGIPFTIFMVLVTSIISYLLYFSSIKKYNPYLIFLTLLFLTLNLLTFFGQYFTLLSIYEMTFLFFAMIFIFKLVKYLNKLIKINFKQIT